MIEYHKTPFKLHSGADEILGKDKRTIATVHDIYDAKYIVEACNKYPILIDLLKRVQCTLAPETIYYKLINQTINS